MSYTNLTEQEIIQGLTVANVGELYNDIRHERRPWAYSKECAMKVMEFFDEIQKEYDAACAARTTVECSVGRWGDEAAWDAANEAKSAAERIIQRHNLRGALLDIRAENYAREFQQWRERQANAMNKGDAHFTGAKR